MLAGIFFGFSFENSVSLVSLVYVVAISGLNSKLCIRTLLILTDPDFI